MKQGQWIGPGDGGGDDAHGLDHLNIAVEASFRTLCERGCYKVLLHTRSSGGCGRRCSECRFGRRGGDGGRGGGRRGRRGGGGRRRAAEGRGRQ